MRGSTPTAHDEENLRPTKNTGKRPLTLRRVRDLRIQGHRKTGHVARGRNGLQYGKANADLDMAVDAFYQSGKPDKVLFKPRATGIFVQVVKALQNKRVAGKSKRRRSRTYPATSKREVDLFMSGYRIPNLPLDNPENTKWGEPGSGRCAALPTSTTRKTTGS